MPVVDISNTICDYQFVFSITDELYVSHHVAGNILERIIKVWNKMFHFLMVA